MSHPDPEIMKRAIQTARANNHAGEHAVAAIVVRGDDIIAQDSTSIIADNDPTAHAELKAIRRACQFLGQKSLPDCYLYTTFEPCPMCTTAAIWARMRGIVYGAHHLDATESHPWRIVIPAAEIISRGTPVLELYGDILREDCCELLRLNISMH